MPPSIPPFDPYQSRQIERDGARLFEAMADLCAGQHGGAVLAAVGSLLCLIATDGDPSTIHLQDQRQGTVRELLNRVLSAAENEAPEALLLIGLMVGLFSLEGVE